MNVSAHDVASYIIKIIDDWLRTEKLQQLLYYCQAWSLVWDKKPLFKEKIRAWPNGPVVKEIYEIYEGNCFVTAWTEGEISRLNKTQRETIDSVIKYYGTKDFQWLSDLIHKEEPWKKARLGLKLFQPSNKIITHASMMEYYSGLKK